MDCTKCDTPTQNNALNGPFDVGNGVVWLCDQHLAEFEAWVESGDDDVGPFSDAEELFTIEGEIFEAEAIEESGRVVGQVDYMPPEILFEAFEPERLEEILKDSNVEWTVSVSPEDE